MSLMKKLSNIIKADSLSTFSKPEYYLEVTQVINELVFNNILNYFVDDKYIYVILNYDESPEYQIETIINLGFYLKDEEKNLFVYECGRY